MKCLSIFFTLLFLQLSGFGQGSGNTLSFNGSNKSINIGNSVANGVRSFEIWFKPYEDITHSLADPITLIARDFNNGDPRSIDEFAICFWPMNWGAGGSGGQLSFARRIGSDLHVIFSDSNNWKANHWYHIAATIEETGMKMYINGILQASVDSSNAPVGSQTGSVTDNVAIGQWGNWNGRFFNGEIDEVRIWETARNQIQVKQFLCSKIDVNNPGLRAYYNFDEISSNLLEDISPNSFDGVLVNMSPSDMSYSGAPIGDTSTFLYAKENLINETVKLTTTNGDYFKVSNIKSNVRGVHLYKVTQRPNSEDGLINLIADNYYGVFLTDFTGAFDSHYMYSDYGCGFCDVIHSRHDNAEQTWTYENGINSQCSIELIAENTSYSYRGEFSISTVDSRLSLNLGKDTTICTGDTLNLQISTQGVNSVLWQDGSSDLEFRITNPGMYWVEVHSDCGTLRDTIDVSITEKPKIDLGKDRIFCDKANLELDVSYPDADYLWNDGSDKSTYTASYPGGKISVTVENQCGVVQDSIVITYLTPPKVDLGNDRATCPGDTLVLNAFFPLSEYLWNTGSRKPTLQVIESGTYRVEVSNKCGSTFSQVEVIVSQFEGLTIPNVFTPNGDGYNDYFEIPEELKGSSLLVYKRTGERIYESPFYLNDWNGNNLPKGVYFYYIFHPCNLEFKGWVKIL